MLFGPVEADNLPEFGGGASSISRKRRSRFAQWLRYH
jgi:hypothetical protein